LWHGGMWGGNANQISIRREMLEMPWKQVDRRPAMPPTKRPVYRPSLEVRERAVGGASAEGRGTAACVSCIVSSASIRLRCRRRLRAVGAARSEICSRRLSYVSCQTSKDDCARRCDRRVLRIFAPFHAGQRGRRSDVSRSTFRSRDRNRQPLRCIVHSPSIFGFFSLSTEDICVASSADVVSRLTVPPFDLACYFFDDLDPSITLGSNLP